MSPVIVSFAAKATLVSSNWLYVILVAAAVFITALAPDVPPVIVSPTWKLPATDAVKVKVELVTLCF